MAIITYLDENEFKKKERALRKYFMKNCKYLFFDFYPALKRDGKKEGHYEVELPVDTLFEKVYGKMKLLFSVYKDTAVLEDILPNDILTAAHRRDLPTYKGVPYATDVDFKKLKIMERLINGN
jgi:hypothetical protein